MWNYLNSLLLKLRTILSDDISRNQSWTNDHIRQSIPLDITLPKHIIGEVQIRKSESKFLMLSFGNFSTMSSNRIRNSTTTFLEKIRSLGECTTVEMNQFRNLWQITKLSTITLIIPPSLVTFAI